MTRRKTRWLTVIGSATFVSTAGAIFTAAGADKPTSGPESTPPRVADLKWIAGHWGMEKNADTLEEIWSKPAGGCLMGMFRWIKDGNVWIYELLTIRDEKDGPVFRFRHFSDELRAWEDKDQPLTFGYVSHTDNEVVFENPQRKQMHRFIFRRDGTETLVVRLEGEKNGKPVSDEFRYTRR